MSTLPPPARRPFRQFSGRAAPAADRESIAAARLRPEAECVAALLDHATLPPAQAEQAQATARRLVETLRAQPRPKLFDQVLGEYNLSCDEGVALMCLAEALLRIPDTATRDALIADKLAGGDWAAHLGRDRSLFVNAASWSLLLSGRLLHDDGAGLAAALTRVIAAHGRPVIRAAIDLAIRQLGERFIAGRTIALALARAGGPDQAGFTHSYDMLGEAALTQAEAERYLRAYQEAIAAVGHAARGRGPEAGPGVSIKLSALHPRYGRGQWQRVMAELLPTILALAHQAKEYDIGLTIDAEEADRLDLSLDILQALCAEPDLAGWTGLGFVIQAYGKRATAVVDFVIDLARSTSRRLMIRLVKGAYWDSEIKRAQSDGLADFPVFTRKEHTDLSYLACARRLLAAHGAVFAQFATHNAQTVAAILALAGDEAPARSFEFQGLHGMGEALHTLVVTRLGRPCRIYAPVGEQRGLLAYLVRRLLENGANGSFLHRLADPSVPIEALIRPPDHTTRAQPSPGAPHPLISLPGALFAPQRHNSHGFDLSAEPVLAWLQSALEASAGQEWNAQPILARPPERQAQPLPAETRTNPACRSDTLGQVVWAEPAQVAAAATAAAAATWGQRGVEDRAGILLAAADALERQGPALIGLVMREAGKTIANAIGELREAVDFLRYYAAAAQADLSGAAHTPLGPVVCISPWNFPLAIFVGQIAAALAAGNPVLAKPAEETPLIAAATVRILHGAGIPTEALQLLPGDGAIGDALVGQEQIRAVMFTGSTRVAARIANRLAGRANAPLTPLIAETGGQNAMIVDSSALPEQVVADVLTSAFDSAGQRCSALRLLCLQNEIAPRTLAMLRGAMAQWRVGNPDRLSTDMGPVISAAARGAILAHVDAMRARGCAVHTLALAEECVDGTFVAPTIIEIDHISQMGSEVFGPVLHVLRFGRDQLEQVIDDINATGYGLTFGLHTRLDGRIAHVYARIRAGNVYVNRTTIGAVVGSQPFGGNGLSGTGPKAGGPLLLHRLLAHGPAPLAEHPAPAVAPAAACALRDWLAGRGLTAEAIRCAGDLSRSRLGLRLELPGPVGEHNVWSLCARGRVLVAAATPAGLIRCLSAVLATGNQTVLATTPALDATLAVLPPTVRAMISVTDSPFALAPDSAVVEAHGDLPHRVAREAAAQGGAIISVHALAADAARAPCLDWLVRERCLSINAAAAGGNAALVART